MQYKDKEGDYMELEFDVKVTPSAMYDYLLHHTYSGKSGIIGTVFGVFLIMAFLATKYPMYRSDWLSAGSPFAKGTSAGQHDTGI